MPKQAVKIKLIIRAHSTTGLTHERNMLDVQEKKLDKNENYGRVLLIYGNKKLESIFTVTLQKLCK